MTVEPESLCWLSGHLSAAVSGTAWAKEFGQFPNQGKRITPSLKERGA
jgi:hypothetical protein